MTTRALEDAGQRISRYLLKQFIINGSYGLVAGLGLFFLGVPYAVLWGFLWRRCSAISRMLAPDRRLLPHHHQPGGVSAGGGSLPWSAACLCSWNCGAIWSWSPGLYGHSIGEDREGGLLVTPGSGPGLRGRSGQCWPHR